jgi:hypothetical protein
MNQTNQHIGPPLIARIAGLLVSETRAGPNTVVLTRIVVLAAELGMRKEHHQTPSISDL